MKPTRPSSTQFDRGRWLGAAQRQRRARTRSEIPVPGRISQALNLRGLYGPEVDVACGAAEPDVDQWEAGELVPTRAQVLALARLTDFPPEFFYQPMTVQVAGLIACGREPGPPVILCSGDPGDDDHPGAPYSQPPLF